jgi:copper transport protein
MTAVLRVSGWCSRATLLLILFGLATVLTTGTASAHAFLERSDPEANAVVPAPPSTVQLWFTEPVEPKYSYAQLFDSNGTLITTPTSQVGADPTQITLVLPSDLAKGTYTIQYRNVSAADGHPNSGYIPFTIGGQADVVVPSPPATVTATTPPVWLNTLGRWLSLLGVTGAVGALFCWRWVILPSCASLSGPRRDVVTRSIRRLALASVAIGVVGSLIALGVQAMAIAVTASVTSIGNVLRDTNYGHIWMIRLVLLVVLGLVLSRRLLWDSRDGGQFWRLGGVMGVLTLVPFALISHAAAQPNGRPAAITADWLHLLATSAWVGGLLALAVSLDLPARDIAAAQRRALYPTPTPRFHTLAIASVIVLAVTGFYASWLQIGNLAALLETSYGKTLLVKLGLLIPLLLLGAVNLRIIGPRLQRNAKNGTHFGRTVTAEAILGIAVLVVVGLLTSLPTAREVLTAQVGQSSFHVFDQGVHATVRVAPAAVGLNRYDAAIGLEKGELPEKTEVLLRVSRQGDIEGIREIKLNPSSGGRFTASGRELSVVGTWQLELLVRRPGEDDWRMTRPIEIGSTPPEARVPGPPPRFSGMLAVAGILAAGGAVAALVVGLRRRTGKRSSLTEVGIGLVLISAVALGTTRISQTASADVQNPIPISAASVTAGEKLFQANCVVCHGVDGRGDGPMAQTLHPPPADLTASHVDAHTDGDMFGWIENGYPGSAMPGFSGQLSETEIWQLVNYVRSLRHPVPESVP